MHLMHLHQQPDLAMVHLLELPDELLIQICEGLQSIDTYNVDSYSWFDKLPSEASDIKSCRLTCHRLCAASSHLLVPVVAVDCRLASLERFNEIIRHPTIGKGIRTVRIPIHSYRRELSEVRTSFVKFIAEPAIHDRASPELCLHNTCEAEYEKKDSHDVGAALGFFRRLIHEDLAPRGDDGCQERQGDETKHGDHVWSRALNLVHGEYQRLFREQESLRRDGDFVNTVALALAKMPHGTVLVFDDKPCNKLDVVNLEYLVQEHCCSLDLNPDFWRSTWYELLSPKTWTDLVSDDFGWESFAPDPAFEEPRMDFVFNLPSAIARAGGQVHHLQFHLSHDRVLGDVTPGITAQPHFALAMQQVKSITIINREGPDDSLIDDYASRLLVNASHLRCLHIAFAYTAPLSEVLVARSLPHLRQIHFDRARIKVSDLVSLLKGLPDHLDAMYLGFVHLVEGTWTEALDALREKSYGSFVIEHPERVAGPDFQAFDPMGSQVFTEEPGGRFMGHRRVPGSLSPAEAFVIRLTSTNPCRR